MTLPAVRAEVLAVLVAGELHALGLRAAEFDDDPIGDLDEDTLALLAAMDELDAERAWDPEKHPRIPKGAPGAGQFLSTVARLKAKLKDHLDGNGDGDPFDGFDREQLRKAAKTRGIQLKRGESRESIAAKLLDDLRKGEDKPSKPKPKVKPKPAPAPPPVPEKPKATSKYGTPGGTKVRESLARAKTLTEVNAAAQAEAARLGAQTNFNFKTGSVQVAREHAEGALRGIERFPDVDLQSVRMFSPTDEQLGTYARALTFAAVIEFSEAWAENESDYRVSLHKDSTSHWHPPGTDSPIGVAVHEYGHVVDMIGLREEIHADASTVFARHYRNGVSPISRYAAKNTFELVAEAFADVVMNGDGASQPSKEIYDLLVAAYNRKYGAKP